MAPLLSNYYTTITNVLGEIIGVARDTSAVVNYAIGVMALDDNTIGGEAHYTSEGGAGGYIAHSPDPVRLLHFGAVPTRWHSLE